jgi:hypothetical protein
MPVTTGTFRVRDDDGREYAVNWEIDPSKTRSLSIPLRYLLADGSGSLNLIGERLFEIAATGKRVRRIA